MNVVEVFAIAVGAGIAAIALVAGVVFVIGYLFCDVRRRSEWKPVSAAAIIERERQAEVTSELPGGRWRSPTRHRPPGVPTRSRGPQAV